MRTKIGTIIVYLMLTCFFVEEASTCFCTWSQSQVLCEMDANPEAENSEPQKEESSSEYSKYSKESLQSFPFITISALCSEASPAIYTETLPVSVERSTFSPPPELG